MTLPTERATLATGPDGLFALVRELEARFGPLQDGDKIRFEHANSLAYPTASAVGVRTDRERARVAVTLIGILGATSPLSLNWLEDLLHDETLRDDDEGTPLRDFLDLLLHPFVAILYEAWQTYALEGAYDLDGHDRLSMRMRALVGVDAWAPPHVDDALPGMVAHGLTDHVRAMPRSIDVPSAAAILRRMFPTLDLRVEAGVERHVTFARSERTILGVQRSRLGRTFACGRGCRTAEGFARICVGPVDQETYEALMPGNDLYARLAALAKRVLPTVAELELEVSTPASNAPTFVLGRRGNRLGSTARISRSKSKLLRVRIPLLLEHDPRIRRHFIST